MCWGLGEARSVHDRGIGRIVPSGISTVTAGLPPSSRKCRTTNSWPRKG